ncbi:DsbA family protein [uncultured Planktomarina sp.]|uniref:DsbA family protein n=1 Tax=uncultured Planktomarina sp. TaxID=1538529 RepID=UPI0032602CD1
MRAIFLALAFVGFAQSVPAQSMTDDQVKQLALEAILENPEIIMQAVAILQQREKEQAASGANTVRLEVESDPNAPNLGNPEGDVTVVEFFDYNCPYCRSAGQTVQALLAADENVRVIYREWPILGDDSVMAARAALAAREQGKYEAFHWALMNGEGRVTEALIFKVARDLGMDVAQLEADMVSPAVEAHIALSNALAQKLGFTGTPAFIVGDKTAPGMLNLDEIAILVAEARAEP